MQNQNFVIAPDSFLAQRNDCKNSTATISYALGVTLPTVGQEPDEIFKECCYNHYVLADLNDSQDFKNDYSAFYHQLQLPNETVEFILYRHLDGSEIPLNDDTYGQYFPAGYFDTNPMLAGYRVDWRKVLQEIGPGAYAIIKQQNIAGLNVAVNSYTFNLRQYTAHLADKTVRVDCVMSGRLERGEIEFSGTGWRHSLRLPGFFGRRDPQYTEDILISTDYNKNQISMSQANAYKFQTNYIPSCLTSELFDFILFGNEIFMNDYNLNNHTYDYVKFPVKISNNEGTQYVHTSRKARVNLVFEDRIADSRKRNYI